MQDLFKTSQGNIHIVASVLQIITYSRLSNIIRVMMRAAVDTPQPMYVMMLKANLSVADNYEK